MGSPSSGGGYGSPTSGYGSPLASGTMYGGGGFSGQQPAYGMGTGGQYSPQLRQAQNAWQQQAAQPQYYGMGAQGRTLMGGQQQAMLGETQVQPYDMMRQSYGMGAQGMGNAYGYGWQGPPLMANGDMSNNANYGWMQQPAAQAQPAQSAPAPAAPSAPPADWNGQAGYDFRHNPATNPNIRPQALAAAQAMQAPPPPPAPRPPPAAPTRANYSPSNPYGGMYANPQADAWEQQQRSGGLPPPVAPQTDVMRKALSGVDNGYGYGTPGGYQLDTAPSTLDPGSMNGLLGFLGGNINGVGYPTSAANYANWYQQTYGQQAPGGPRAYPF